MANHQNKQENIYGMRHEVMGVQRKHVERIVQITVSDESSTNYHTLQGVSSLISHWLPLKGLYMNVALSMMRIFQLLCVSVCV